MGTTKGRVVLSGNPVHSLDLAQLVYDKHQSDGAASLLLSLEEHDWAITGPKIAPCLAKHKEAEALSKAAEEAYRVRDAMLTEINAIVKDSKTLLKGKYVNNPKKLGEWGFVVDDTPKAKKKAAPKG